MKKFTLISIAVLMASLTLSSCNSGGKSSDNQEKDFKTMVVEYNSSYEMMGVKMTEKETTWVDIKNKKEASLSMKTSVIMGVESIEETLEIKDGDWAYSINLKDKTGTKANVGEIKDMAQMLSGMIDVDVTGLKDFIEKSGGKVLANESFLGKDCFVYELMGTKNWMYKGVILKSMLGDKIMKEAVKIEEDVTIPSERFEVPKGIAITEVKDIFNAEE